MILVVSSFPSISSSSSLISDILSGSDLELVKKNELSTTCWDKEVEKPHELRNLLSDQELEELLVDKSFMNNAWSNQLQQNLFENEKNMTKKKKKKKLEINNEFRKSFENMIFKKKLLPSCSNGTLPEQLLPSFLATKHGRSTEKLRKRSASTSQWETKIGENSLTAKNFRQTASGHFAPATSKTAASKKRPSKKRPSQTAASQKAPSQRAASQRAA